MIAMIGSMMIPGLPTTTVVSVEPSVLLLGFALAAAVAWMIRGTARELTRLRTTDRATQALAPSRPPVLGLAA